MKNVSFSHLEIRCYDITLGDAPTSHGPPITLDWSYDKVKTAIYGVDAYESCRQRRTRSELIMPPSYREERLADEGFTRSEIKRAIEEAQRAFKERQKTAKNSMKGNSWPNLNMIMDKVKGNNIMSKKFAWI